MKLLLASSEVHPYSKTGGLADMVGAFAKSLAGAGHQVTVVTPLYRGIPGTYPDLLPFDYYLNLPLDQRWIEARIWKRAWQPNLDVLFLDVPEFFDRDGLYQFNSADHPDNASRFIYFSKCVAHLARYLPNRPDVVHVHDWQAALAALVIAHQRSREAWPSPPKTCLTIHNLAYQGVFERDAYRLINLPWDYYHPDGAEHHGQLNCLKAGIAHADLITTVSPRYAREIMTEALGCGLDGLLRLRSSDLAGILNGVDYSEWNTVNNPFLEHPYDHRSPGGKALEKRQFQEEFGLDASADIPLFATVTRLADQKGGDILLGALEEMLSREMQFALLGSGAAGLERGFIRLARRHGNKVVLRLGYDSRLAHRIEAASDFYLMPSRFEPCGLNQMYSLRYGSIPIVRATGGLDDTVLDASEDAERADGIKFREYSPGALSKAMRKALFLYGDKKLMGHYRKNGMTKDFSWEATTGQYVSVFNRLLAR